MRHITFLLLLLVTLTASAGDIDYQIAGAGSGTQGTYLVSVSIVSKKGTVKDDDFKYGAVHGVIFRGFTGAERQPSQRPMAPATAESERAEFFKPFFDEGAYANYASVVPGSYTRTKLSKGGYRVTATLSVQKDELRHALERAGAIRTLTSGF